MKGDFPINRETYLSLYGITEEQVGTLRPMSSLKFSEINKIVSIILDKETSCGSIEWLKKVNILRKENMLVQYLK